MALFDGIRNNWRKAEAATIVQQLLEQYQRLGLVSRNPAKYANELVEAAWQQCPQLYDGSRGVVPHKVAVAASALAHGAKSAIRQDPQDSGTYALVLCLGSMLQDVAQNDFLYTFNRLDEHLLSRAAQSFSELSETVETHMAHGAEAAKTTGETARQHDLEEDLDPVDVEVMHEYGITYKEGQYHFQSYRYDHLQDAVNYAKRITVRGRF